MVRKMEDVVIKISEAKSLKDIPIKDMTVMSSKIKKIDFKQNNISNSIFSSLKKKISEKQKEIEKKDRLVKILENNIKCLKKDNANTKKKSKFYEREIEEIHKSLSYRFGEKMSKNIIGKSIKKILRKGDT